MSVNPRRFARTILYAFVPFALSLVSLRTATACGTIEDLARAYSSEATDARRQERLQDLLCVSFYEYHGRASDDLLLSVLADAVARGYDKRLARAVFEYYRCIPSASDRFARDRLSSELDGSSCPSAEEVARWRSVAARSVHMRAGASATSRKIGYLMHGNVVTLLSTSGQWSRVKTWWDEEGYVLSELLEPVDSR